MHRNMLSVKTLTSTNPETRALCEIVAHVFAVAVIVTGFWGLPSFLFGFALAAPMYACFWVWSGTRWMHSGAPRGGRILIGMGFLVAVLFVSLAWNFLESIGWDQVTHVIGR